MSGMRFGRSRDMGHAHGGMLRSLSRGVIAKIEKIEKIQSALIELKFGTGMVWTTPDTMVMFILRKNDVISRPRPLTHLQHEKSKCSNHAEIWYRYVLDHRRHDGDVYFA